MTFDVTLRFKTLHPPVGRFLSFKIAVCKGFWDFILEFSVKNPTTLCVSYPSIPP